jgi:carbon-monoxide dehydrogenase small subunit
MAKRLINMKVNGSDCQLEVTNNETLSEVLRSQLNLTSVREACGQGECGCCTVIVDKNPICSCIMLAIHADGREITTVEGLACNGELHILQEKFLTHNAFQCGFCTPGMILKAKCLLEENPNPTTEEIRSYLNGNLCRCGSYGNIIKAVKAVAEG